MYNAIVFDAYGTLFDINTVVDACEREFPGRGLEVCGLWRHKQLEYTWLRGLMERYADFETVTRDALRYALGQLGIEGDEVLIDRLADVYQQLAPHPEVLDAIELFLPRKLLVLSNGTDRMLHKVLGHSGLGKHFSGIFSVDILKKYKPHPDVYALAAQHLNLPPDEILFVSNNGWDVAGAKNYGYQVAWINRLGERVDELGVTPEFNVSNLMELAEEIL